ncbi:hypothetical protein SprV_0802593900 [Sparganum proliferum]
MRQANWKDFDWDRPTWRSSSRESQTRHTQISTGAPAAAAAAAAATASQRQRPIISNVSSMPSGILDANWTIWTPPVRLRHTDCTNPRLSPHLSRASHDVN